MEDEHKKYSFYLADGTIKEVETTKEMALIAFRKSKTALFFIEGVTDRYVFKNGIWTTKKGENTDE